MQQEVTNKVFTIPNLLTLLRLLLLPVFCVLLVKFEQNLLAFLVLLVAALTDAVDGLIARSTNTISKIGQQLDPLVDRIFIIVCVLSIWLAGRLPVWIMLLLLARDAAMLALTIYQKRHFGRSFRVIFLGKLTTALLMAGFCSQVLLWPMLPGAGMVDNFLLPGWGEKSEPLGIWLLYAGTFFSLLTGLIYFIRGTRPPVHEVRPRTPLAVPRAGDVTALGKRAGSRVDTRVDSGTDSSRAAEAVGPATATSANATSTDGVDVS
ncbi:MAG: CDP-alcohol phosphatidyltransferase family protein [Coriobacteriales bacterium]|nr:CDP-alcohol phosphatidyltransferase family protein [Coriobacteriales bacterium]